MKSGLHDIINFPKKTEAINNDKIIKNLKMKIQKQEIDIKFLNEKLKRVQNENNFGRSNQERMNSKLSAIEVYYLIIFRSKTLVIYYFTCIINQSY